MNPNSGDMRRLTSLEAELLEKQIKARPEEPAQSIASGMFPGQVLWREGEEIEIRGCWFRVAAIRRTRVALVPIPRINKREVPA